MTVEEYLEGFSPSVRPKMRMPAIEGEGKKFAGEVRMVEGKVKVVEREV